MFIHEKRILEFLATTNKFAPNRFLGQCSKAALKPFREKRTISKAFSDFESLTLAIRWGSTNQTSKY